MKKFLIAIRIYKRNIFFRNSQIKEGVKINVRILWSKKRKLYVNSSYFSDEYINNFNYYETIA